MVQLYYDPEQIIHLGDETVIVTLHNGTYHEDADGFADENEVIPEIARVEVEKFVGGTVRFDNLPECDANHIAVWTIGGRLLLRAYCFPVEGFPGWAQTRHIPAGGSVEVNIA